MITLMKNARRLTGNGSSAKSTRLGCLSTVKKPAACVPNKETNQNEVSIHHHSNYRWFRQTCKYSYKHMNRRIHKFVSNLSFTSPCDETENMIQEVRLAKGRSELINKPTLILSDTTSLLLCPYQKISIIILSRWFLMNDS